MPEDLLDEAALVRVVAEEVALFDVFFLAEFTADGAADFAAGFGEAFELPLEAVLGELFAADFA